jgi:hypothetical protein
MVGVMARSSKARVNLDQLGRAGPLIPVFTIFCVFFTNLANSQVYDKERADAFFRLQTFCLNRVAPEGGDVRRDPFFYDVAKEQCMCVSDSVLAHLGSRDGLSPQHIERHLAIIMLECKNRVFSKREPEVLDGYNKALILRGIPPVSRFPWHYWFD